MNCKKTILAVIALSLLAGLGFGLRLMATDPPEGPLSFNGYFQTRVHHGMNLWHFTVSVKTSQNQFVHGIMTFNGRPMNEMRKDGYIYYIKQEGSEFPAGRPLIMTFQSNAVGSPLYTAKIQAPPPIHFSSPERNAHVQSVRKAMLVSWSGGTPPYHLYIQKEVMGGVIWLLDEVAATSFHVPIDKCIPGNDYTILVISKDLTFTFDRPVTPGCVIYFSQRASISFHLD